MRSTTLANQMVTWALILAGSLLLAGGVAANLTPFLVPASDASSWLTVLGDLLPIPGGVNGTPEINPGSAVNALAVLAIGGTLLLVGVRRRQ